jgi:hypothetical protein
LADYVDSGGKVINSLFSIGNHGWEVQGRFMTEGYTALKGGSIAYSPACLGNYSKFHPVMNGISYVCDSLFFIKNTYTTPASKSIAMWDTDEIFVAVKSDRSVVSINGYFGLDYAWSGQMNELIHNAIYWLYSGNRILWNQPLSVSFPDYHIANQDMPDNPNYTSFIADDFSVDKPVTINTIFMPGGWGGPVNLANASEMSYFIYEDNSGVPAGDPTGSGDPPVWSISLPITDPHLTLYADSRHIPTNMMLELPTSLQLAPGHYWLIGFPTLIFSPYGQYGRPQSDTTNGYLAQWINPGNGFGKGTDWIGWYATTATLWDAAFRVEGEAYDVFLPLVIK